ncbi:Probable methyltransferase PMT14 [Linum perenne]
MGSKHNPNNGFRSRSPLSIFLILCLCCFSYLLGTWQRSGFGKGDTIARQIAQQTDCDVLKNLNFDSHHNIEIAEKTKIKYKVYKPCDASFTDYTPCQEQDRERHCPPVEEKLHCLVPAPKGYTAPFPWPKSRDYVYYANVPFKSLTVEKANQNWVQYQGNVFKFPGGADAYIDELASVIPIADGSVRTALDTGCGVASWGAYMLKRNVLAMSFAPRDNHEAQVQFALERGVPAVIGVLGTIRLPYPSRAFDMAQCSRCLIPWTANDGMYLMEVDRVLRPGGYWVLSGPPINWKTYYKTWKRTKQDLQAEQKSIEDLAESLCWEKKYEKGDIAIFRKMTETENCKKSVNLCDSVNDDDVWNKEMEKCKTPYPEKTTESELKKFPQRLFAVPPRVSNGIIDGVTEESYLEDNKLWKKRVTGYKRINRLIGTGRYRNVMDMNAGLGGFAAALESPKSWVMNVVPTIQKNTLGVVYERGLIGIYHDWCEGFSTYPRTYDLIHADHLFSLYKNKCSVEDILLEMDRILRPEGTVLIRDEVDVVNEVMGIIAGMRWDTRMLDHEDGPLVDEKILVGVKQYWTGGSSKNSTETDG